MPVNINLLLLLTWLVPGMGHVILKSRYRAMVYIAVILLMLILGILLHGRLFVPVKGDIISYLATLANLGLGFLYFLLSLVLGYRGRPEAVNSDYGTLFILSAGLMNLLLLIEVYDIAKGKRRAT